MDLKEAFDRALDGGPAHRPIEDRLAVGRRATRRRRTAMGATTLAMIAVVGGIGWAAMPRPGDAVDGTVATSPTSTSAPTPTPEIDPTAERTDPLLGFGMNGNLVSRPGVEVERRMTDLIDQPRVDSMAAVVRFEGQTFWTVMAVLPGLSTWANDHSAIDNRTFEQWVHEQIVLNADVAFDDEERIPDWVTLDADGVLTPHEGATIIEQTTPARLDQAPAHVPSATATIEVDGARLCVIASALTSDSDVVYLAESEFQGCADALPALDYPGNPVP